jgi:DNA-directed RNA polymerase subunit RPC12/RpoP
VIDLFIDEDGVAFCSCSSNYWLAFFDDRPDAETAELKELRCVNCGSSILPNHSLH